MELRAQKSSVLGFSTHADFVLEMNMAKSGKKVAGFLGEFTASEPEVTPESSSYLQRGETDQNFLS